MVYWLRSLVICVKTPGPSVLRPDEQKLLDMVMALVRETELADLLVSAGDYATQTRMLAAYIARLWAATSKGFRVFEIVYIVGQSRSVAADTQLTRCYNYLTLIERIPVYDIKPRFIIFQRLESNT
jgi:hypothetical protein